MGWIGNIGTADTRASASTIGLAWSDTPGLGGPGRTGVIGMEGASVGTLTGGAAAGAGPVITTGVSAGGALGAGVAISGAVADGAGTAGGGATKFGCAALSWSSRYSAVILSSELEATRAAMMPSSLALARTSLFSRPSFFEMS